MPLEPLEFLSALLLWSATVAMGFRRWGEKPGEKGEGVLNLTIDNWEREVKGLDDICGDRLTIGRKG